MLTRGRESLIYLFYNKDMGISVNNLIFFLYQFQTRRTALDLSSSVLPEKNTPILDN